MRGVVQREGDNSGRAHARRITMHADTVCELESVAAQEVVSGLPGSSSYDRS
jgi:hypothetical protein